MHSQAENESEDKRRSKSIALLSREFQAQVSDRSLDQVLDRLSSLHKQCKA
jgi:hypothetical protein